MRTDISDRILSLSDSYSTDKEFLKTCEIRNHSLLTELRKGRLKRPGAEILAKIVRGTGCSGTWLLTGSGEKFPAIDAERARAPREVGQREMAYIEQAARLLDRIDEAPDYVKKQIAGGELPIKFSEISVQLIKLQRNSDNRRD